MSKHTRSLHQTYLGVYIKRKKSYLVLESCRAWRFVWPRLLVFNRWDNLFVILIWVMYNKATETWNAWSTRRQESQEWLKFRHIWQPHASFACSINVKMTTTLGDHFLCEQIIRSSYTAAVFNTGIDVAWPHVSGLPLRQRADDRSDFSVLFPLPITSWSLLRWLFASWNLAAGHFDDYKISESACPWSSPLWVDSSALPSGQIYRM